jgi:hypothetical protein
VLQFLELFALLRCELLADFLTDSPKLFLDFRRDEANNNSGAFLALLEDFGNAIVLLAAKIEVAVHPLQELAAREIRDRDNVGLLHTSCRTCGPIAERALRHKGSRQHTGPKDNDRGQNDFPGAHQLSMGCSAAANTVDSSVTGSDSEFGQNDQTDESAVMMTQATAARQSAGPQTIQPFGAGVARKRAMMRCSKA